MIVFLISMNIHIVDTCSRGYSFNRPNSKFVNIRAKTQSRWRISNSGESETQQKLGWVGLGEMGRALTLTLLAL